MTARRLLLPISVFAAVWIFHYVFLTLFPEGASIQAQWLSVEGHPTLSVWGRYVASRSYYLSYTYALSLSFAATTYRRYREKQSCTTRRVALGGIGISGILSVGGCFLLGCCGSPMLGVYLSMFGASFFPFAKPLVAGISTLMLLIAWIWVRRKEKQLLSETSCECLTASVAVED